MIGFDTSAMMAVLKYEPEADAACLSAVSLQEASMVLAGRTGQAAAWQELEWLGREIAVGGARLRIIASITRCAATEVNPETAERDMDLVGTLQRSFGHNLMGIYAEVVGPGEIAVGDMLVT